MCDHNITYGPRLTVKGTKGAIQFSDGGEDLSASELANVQVNYTSSGEVVTMSVMDLVVSNTVIAQNEVYAGGNLTIVGDATISSNLSVGSPSNLHVDTLNSRVGINTDAPTETLEVNGLTLTANTEKGNVPTLSVDNSFDLNYGYNRNYRWNLRRDNGLPGETTWGGDLILSDWSGATQLDHVIHIKNSDDTIPGAVGIGTSVPSAKLHVNGSTYLDGSLTVRSSASGAVPIIKSATTTADNSYNYILNAYRPSESSGGAVMFINGVNNSSDGVNSCFTIRNDSGPLRLGNSGKTTSILGTSVGIGTEEPYAKLHVIGTGSGTLNGVPARFFNYETALSYSDTALFGYVSIFASDDIVAGGWIGSTSGTITASDRRIKSNIQDISDTVALDQLRLLQPKTYQYKDVRSRGTESVIGFIAQEVKEVIPTAVTIRTQSIPNIYELVNVYQSNVITFANFNTSNLNATSNIINIKTVTGGDERVTLANVIDEHTIQVVEDLSKFTGSVDENGNVITETITTTTTYTREEYDALENRDGVLPKYNPEITTTEYEALTDEEKEMYTVTYSKTETETVNVGDSIFVYGQQVNDFNFLKKESIFTIATAALQEVDRQQQADKERIATLESQVAALLTRIEALENNNP